MADVGDVGKVTYSNAETGDCAVVNPKGADHHAAEVEELGDINEFDARYPDSGRELGKSVGKDSSDIALIFGRGVDGDWSFVFETESADVIHSHDVVGVRVGDEDGFEVEYPFAKELESHFGGAIDEDVAIWPLKEATRPGAMVSWVGEELRGILFSERRDAIAGARPQNDRVRHYPWNERSSTLAATMVLGTSVYWAIRSMHRAKLRSARSSLIGVSSKALATISVASL